jgi:ABC-type transport system involved in Fe-S cluster assembly fused permease/ATPase subunit
VLSPIRHSFSDLRQLVRLVWSDTSPHIRARLLAVLLLVITAATLTALGPVALKRLVDGFAGDASPASVTVYVLVTLYVGSQWLSRSAGELRGLIYARVERRMFRALSERVFGHLMRLPMRFHVNRRTGAITQALENGLQGYQIVMHHVVFTFLPVLAELGTIVVILSRLGQPAFLILFCGALVCYGGAFAYAAVAVRRPAQSASAAAVDSTAAMTDPLLAVETVKHFTAEELVERRVSAALARTEREWVGFYRRYACNGIAVATIFATFLAATVAYATREVQLGRMTVGEFVLINTYMLQVVRPVEMVGYAMQGLSQGSAMLQKMLALLAEAPEPYRTDHCTAIRGPGRLEFERVAASYLPDREVLRNTTFGVEAGRTVGIVGPSGSGKSTIVRLLVRTLEPHSGRILLDGVPIQDFPLTQLRRAIAVVAQDTALFNDSIGNNIALGRPDASQAEIEEAARAARLHDFIMSLPEGYETQVGERGVKLSGGERQRLAIARAILKNPLVFVFDEATSALDSNNERAILSSLIEVSRARTTIIIAHRLSTVVHADEIVVLDRGTIVERGSHAELLRMNGTYAGLWSAQHHAGLMRRQSSAPMPAKETISTEPWSV